MCLSTITSRPEPPIEGVGYKIFCTGTGELQFSIYPHKGSPYVGRGCWLQANPDTMISRAFGYGKPVEVYGAGFHIYLERPKIWGLRTGVFKVRFRGGHTVGLNSIPPYFPDSPKLPCVVASGMYVPTDLELTQRAWQ